ncbi:MAG: LamG domain-containing protein, partial [Desulfuromonadales bacterium]|nr:LamG domain-containing protein [Desulfuromonadales bacterium]
MDNIAAGTIVAWIKPAKLQNDNGIFTKNGGSAGPTFFQHTTSGNLRLDIPRATTNLVVQANSNELAANQWSFVAARWDVNGVDGDQQLYWGNLTTILAEVGGYAFQQVGSGAQADDSANNAVWGNMRSGGVGWGRYDGDIAIGILFDRKLSLSELKVLQFKILPL